MKNWNYKVRHCHPHHGWSEWTVNSYTPFYTWRRINQLRKTWMRFDIRYHDMPWQYAIYKVKDDD